MIGTLCAFYFGGAVATFCHARNLENTDTGNEEVDSFIQELTESTSVIEDLVGAICWPIEVYSYIRKNKN